MTPYYYNKKKKKKQINLLTLAAVVYIMVLAISGTFGDRGAIQNYRLYRQNEILKDRIGFLEAENKARSREIDDLVGNPRYIEKIAREELGLSRDGEIIFVFKKKNDRAKKPE